MEKATIGSISHSRESMLFAKHRSPKKLPDPVPGFKIGDTSEKLEALGEGKKIVVVANALAVRKGNPESCNCGLSAVGDTDNHIVLVDRKPSHSRESMLFAKHRSPKHSDPSHVRAS